MTKIRKTETNVLNIRELEHSNLFRISIFGFKHVVIHSTFLPRLRQGKAGVIGKFVI